VSRERELWSVHALTSPKIAVFILQKTTERVDSRPDMSPRVYSILISLLSLLMASCESSSTSENKSNIKSGCGVSITLSGEVSSSINYNINDGCGGPLDASTGFYTSHGVTTAYSIRVNVTGIVKGEVASSLTGSVRVFRPSDSAIWQTPSDCTINITRNELVAGTVNDYITAGNGTCTSVAVASGGGATTDVNIVGEFSFESTALTWN